MEEKNPKVSICIPTYKQVEFLEKTLNSIAFQTYTDFEVIVSDDSPDDSVFNLLKKYSFGKKLKYIRNQPSLGSPENWNNSVRNASGEYIKILHHDDWFTYDYSLLEYIKLLDQNPKADFAFSGSCVYHADTQQTRIHCIPNEHLEKVKKDPLVLFFGNYIGAPSATIYRRKLNIHYDERMKWLVDMDFYIRVLTRNPSIAFNSETLITNTTAADHIVTNQCVANKQVEVFEHLWLYNKISPLIKKENSLVYIDHLWKLFNRHGIQTSKEIKEIGITSDLPVILKNLLLYRKIFRPLFKWYYKKHLPQNEIKNHPYYGF